MPYYPNTNVIMGLARVQRERRLPPEATPVPLPGVMAGADVEAVNDVLYGDVLGAYRFIDVPAYFKMRRPKPDELANIIVAEAGKRAQLGQELARKGKGRRAKVLASPVEGRIVRVTEDGIIVLQRTEQHLEMKARISGTIDEAEPHRLRISSNGAVLQCAWGNGGFAYAPYKALPEEGFPGLAKIDVTITDYRAVVIVTDQPLNQGDLLVCEQHYVSGVVAPSMPANLREFAMERTFAVVLTEGFGHLRPSALIYRLLQDNMGRQAAINAAVPDPWRGEYPEIVIPLPSKGILPPTPVLDQALQVGAQVRITRAPYQGLMGQVIELPATPQTLENGLRLPSAAVRLPSNRVVLVPLANVELLGPPADMPPAGG